jgi:hypothetical protein
MPSGGLRMKYLLLGPAAAAMVLAFAMQLTDIAESTQEKTIKYADDMNAALDCAFKGVDLSVCSPDLYNHDFKQDINRTESVLREIRYITEDSDGNQIIVFN